MSGLWKQIQSNGILYLLVASYGCLVFNMTSRLWFGDGVNIFATYSDAQELSRVVLDANKVYWSKTSFLFLTILSLALNINVRAAIGLGAVFWSSSLILMFGPSQNLGVAFVLGVLLVLQQLRRKQFFGGGSLSS